MQNERQQALGRVDIQGSHLVKFVIQAVYWEGGQLE